MTGGVLIIVFLIPMMLIVINHGKSKVHPMQNMKETEELIRRVSKGIQIQEPDQFKEFGKKLRLGNQTRMRSSSTII